MMIASSAPNIFTHATSELSQDAFIAYLLEWANPTTYTADGDLVMHQVGLSFLQLLLRDHGVNTDNLTSVEVKSQQVNIDVLAKLSFADGRTIALVIEDKIHAGSYNNLDKYINAAKGIYPEAGQNFYGVYLRTGNQADYGSILVKNFKVVTRKDVLGFMRDQSAATSNNTVFRDFSRHLSKYQKRIDSFRTEPVDNWTHDAWIGFYHQILCERPEIYFDLYGYVPNPQGGFHGCWWPDDKRFSFHGQPAYLQIEKNGVLTFKLGPVAPEAQSGLLGSSLFTLIDRKAKKMGMVKGDVSGNTIRERNEKRLIKRSLSIRGANFMTVAFVPREDWFPTGLDTKKSVETLLMYQNFLRNVISTHE